MAAFITGDLLLSGALLLYGFSGLLFGSLLTKIAPEEITAGRQTLSFFRSFFLVIFIFTILSVTLSRGFSLVFLIPLIIGFFLGKFIRDIYVVLGIALWSVFSQYHTAIYVSIILFLYGLFEGSLTQHLKLTKRFLLYVVPLLVVILLSPSLPTVSQYASYFFIGFIIHYFLPHGYHDT